MGRDRISALVGRGPERPASCPVRTRCGVGWGSVTRKTSLVGTPPGRRPEGGVRASSLQSARDKLLLGRVTATQGAVLPPWPQRAKTDSHPIMRNSVAIKPPSEQIGNAKGDEPRPHPWNCPVQPADHPAPVGLRTRGNQARAAGGPGRTPARPPAFPPLQADARGDRAGSPSRPPAQAFPPRALPHWM